MDDVTITAELIKLVLIPRKTGELINPADPRP